MADQEEIRAMNMTGGFNGKVNQRLVEEAWQRQMNIPGKIGQRTEIGDVRFRSTMRANSVQDNSFLL